MAKSWLKKIFNGSGGTSSNSIPDTAEFDLGNVTDLSTPFILPISLANESSFQFQPSDQGRVFTINSANNPIFIANLTNGLPDYIGQTYRIGGNTGNAGGQLAQESDYFDSYAPGFNGVDFQGYDITSVTLTLNSLSFTSPGSNPNQDGNWTDFTYLITIDVNGIQTTPEPSTWAMLLGRLSLLVFWRLRSNGKPIFSLPIRE